jgi:hypothetical protein
MLCWPWADFSFASAWANFEMAALRARSSSRTASAYFDRFPRPSWELVLEEEAFRRLGRLELRRAVPCAISSRWRSV